MIPVNGNICKYGLIFCTQIFYENPQIIQNISRNWILMFQEYKSTRKFLFLYENDIYFAPSKKPRKNWGLRKGHADMKLCILLAVITLEAPNIARKPWRYLARQAPYIENLCDIKPDFLCYIVMRRNLPRAVVVSPSSKLDFLPAIHRLIEAQSWELCRI